MARLSGDEIQTYRDEGLSFRGLPLFKRAENLLKSREHG